jgi:hypothetical protein
MPIDPLAIVAIAVVALFVASTVAQRAGDVADRRAGRARVAQADRRGPLGPLIDLFDRSVAAYNLRSRLGLSTQTREQRRVADQRAAAIARADQIRHARTGGSAPHLAPKRLVVAGPGGGHGAPGVATPRSTLSVELLAAGLGLAVVIGVVVGIWPRERGGVLSATGIPATGLPAIASPSPSPSPSDLRAAPTG